MEFGYSHLTQQVGEKAKMDCSRLAECEQELLHDKVQLISTMDVYEADICVWRCW